MKRKKKVKKKWGKGNLLLNVWTVAFIKSWNEVSIRQLKTKNRGRQKYGQDKGTNYDQK